MSKDNMQKIANDILKSKGFTEELRHQLFLDTLLYGTCVTHIDKDGNVKRIDPLRASKETN